MSYCTHYSKSSFFVQKLYFEVLCLNFLDKNFLLDHCDVKSPLLTQKIQFFRNVLLTFWTKNGTFGTLCALMLVRAVWTLVESTPFLRKSKKKIIWLIFRFRVQFPPENMKRHSNLFFFSVPLYENLFLRFLERKDPKSLKKSRMNEIWWYLCISYSYMIYRIFWCAKVQ